jgi:hypothetical protein
MTLIRISVTWDVTHTLTANVLDLRNNQHWMETGVYGPQGTLEKKMFIRELKLVKQIVSPHWLLLGDFNLICQDAEKSNGHVDRNMMHRFRRVLNHLEVKEI